MESENHESIGEGAVAENPIPLATTSEPDSELTPVAPPEVERGIHQLFLGPQGLRAGWSVLIFIASFVLLAMALSFPLAKIIGKAPGPMSTQFTASRMMLSEAVQTIALLGAMFIVALIEQRRVLDFNLRGSHRFSHFLGGVAAGFIALSCLVGALYKGGWVHFNGLALSGATIAKYALLWGIVFLLVGFSEEGLFRCYLQFTLTRGLSFWSALGINAALCLDLAIRAKGNGVWGDYAIALLGLAPCIWLYLKRVQNGGFWYAAWVTSTLFGFVHTSNGGENPVGIFQAAFVGAIFCVSIKVTGSAWWAIGTHAGWDWAQTYFYGTPDSGMVGTGHLFNSAMVGNPFWSGGADGPEGSVLGIGILILLLIWVVAVYGRSHKNALSS